MLSSSSCESGKLSSPNSPRKSCLDRACLNGTTFKEAPSINHLEISIFINVLLAALLLAAIHLQCSESRSLLDVNVTSKPIEVLDLNPEEAACFCNGKFYQSCPPKQSGCIIRKKPPRRPNAPLSPDPYEIHDSEHPDHVELFDNARWKQPIGRDPRARSNAETISDNPNPSDLDALDQPVVLHRKVYVTEKRNDFEPVIHPIDITIPVKIKDEQDPPLPPPKPVFKMRKYTSYETRPEIEMVPVTTTVIKPVGVTEDQIIDYKKSP